MNSIIYRSAVGDALLRIGLAGPERKSDDAQKESALISRAWADGQSVWMCVFDVALMRHHRAVHERSWEESNRSVLRRAMKESAR